MGTLLGPCGAARLAAGVALPPGCSGFAPFGLPLALWPFAFALALAAAPPAPPDRDFAPTRPTSQGQ
eukprot:12646934-Alexandrium_andersonii.AAC.1